MPKCFLCEKDFDNIKSLFKHFDIQHFNHEFNFYQCNEAKCTRSFYLKNSFRKHLAKHSIDDFIQPSTIQPLVSSISTSESTLKYFDSVPNSAEKLNNKQFIEPSEILNKTISNFLSILYANSIISRNVVQIVVDGMETVFSEGIVACIKTYIQQMIFEGKISEENFNIFTNIFNMIENSFSNFKTEHKRFSYFAEQGSFVKPKEKIVGQRLNTVMKGGISVLKPFNCTEQCIPLRSVLKNFFSLENVLTETLDYMASLKNESGILTNFIQGTYWKSRMIKHEGRIVLPLFMFFDDYESGNVLGSHSGIHKLGAVYVSIPCIPPHRTTLLSNIFLALLFHSSDRVQFGNKVIFKPIIDEFNFLMANGVDIDMPFFTGKLYFELGLILGDNLGLHSITGFVESFSSNFCCRICTMGKSDIKVKCYEDKSLLRNNEQYFNDLKKNDLSATGLKEECIWLNVTDFSLFDQVGVDIMHDLLEGCAKYIMSFILKSYIKELKLFSLKVLNDRIFAFDYGPEHNKPCIISMDHINVGKMKQSASEMLTFIRYFGLLIGDFVPVGEPIWYLYLSMRRVLDIALSTSLEENSCLLLETVVGEMNELYLKLSKNDLKPKFHFLTHYSSMIKKHGPVVHLWSMRYEAKHRISKISARSSFNRRNICMSLAIKHQLQLNEVFNKGKLCSTINVGPRKILNSLKIGEIKTEFNLSSDEQLVRVSWAEIKGTRYKINSILTRDVDDENPQFILIKDIFLNGSERIIFECCMFTTIGFNEQFYAYEVEIHELSNCFIFQDSLISPIPNTLNVVSNGAKYVTVRDPL
ncbi:unnamed protein product [Macrosiphum euphorbiae]|uniref:C2H2-type domain-containing protein n=1 Tax=Macrosiphum euphorbiae TaxID=13131 RepID=A0AAV0W328_9HEMI|nr:unnamed protein product [Macrosiphum euphorbiae]